MNRKIYHIDRLKKAVVNHLSWGPVDYWSTRNFEELSQRVLAETKIQLSVSTLKRFFGKVNYESLPSSTTLDALSTYIGYSNFSDFLSRNRQPFFQRFDFRSRRLLFSFLIVGVSTATLLIVSFVDSTSRRVDPDKISFAVKRVAIGLPNTVVFEYDVSQVDAKTVQIQQDWDPTKRHMVDPAKSIYTHFYQYPGYFNAKLLVNGEVVATQDLFIPSDGWLATISDPDQTRKPYYVEADELDLSSGVSTGKSLDSVLTRRDDEIVLEYFNAFSEPSYDFDDLTLEADVRFFPPSGKYPCELRKVVLLGTKQSMKMEIRVPGCAAMNTLRLGSHFIDGEDHDLSKFTVSSGEWAHVRISYADKYLIMSVGEEEIFQMNLLEDFGKIAGVRFSFLGTGEVKNLSLQVKDTVLLATR